MNQNIDVTISIVSFNTKEEIKKCITSIYRYTKKINFEVIVVDNASGDGTQKMIQENFPEVLLIANKKNNFYGKANNQAVRLAKGKYFLILNADTYFKNDSISRMVQFMNERPEAGAVEGLEIYEDGKLIPNGSKHNTPLLDFYELSFVGKHFKNQKLVDDFRYVHKNRKETFEVEVGCDAFLVIRTKLLKEIHGYDEKLLLYYTENDICLRIAQKGYKIIHFGKAYVYHKVSVSANKLKWRKLDLYYDDLLYYYNIHGYAFWGTLLFLLLKFEKVFLRIFRSGMFD